MLTLVAAGRIRCRLNVFMGASLANRDQPTAAAWRRATSDQSITL